MFGLCVLLLTILDSTIGCLSVAANPLDIADLPTAEVAAPPLIVIKDMQLAVPVAHVATMTRRLANPQWRGQATVAKARQWQWCWQFTLATMVEADAAQEQTTINYKAVAISGEMIVVAETVAAMAVAAAMATAAMATAAMQQPGCADSA